MKPFGRGLKALMEKWSRGQGDSRQLRFCGPGTHAKTNWPPIHSSDAAKPRSSALAPAMQGSDSIPGSRFLRRSGDGKTDVRLSPILPLVAVLKAEVTAQPGTSLVLFGQRGTGLLIPSCTDGTDDWVTILIGKEGENRLLIPLDSRWLGVSHGIIEP